MVAYCGSKNIYYQGDGIFPNPLLCFMISHIIHEIVLLILLLCFACGSRAQNRQTLVFGNIHQEDVNITVLNTRYGTSSDAEGRYELLLFERTKPVDLLYTCIGYRDTVVSLTPSMLQHDSVSISFMMRRTNYDLQEVGVSASRDFYRTEKGTSIADIGFWSDKMLVLEQRKGKSELVVVSLEGERVAQCAFDSLYETIHVDCLGDYILVGTRHCCQVYFDGGNSPVPFKTFSTSMFNERLLNCVADFGGALVFKNRNANIGRFFVRKDHNKTQRYFYVKKDDPSHEKRSLVDFSDEESLSKCNEIMREIFQRYHQKMRNQSENENILLNGLWDGNLLKLLPFDEVHEIGNPDDALIIALVSDYVNFESLPLNIVVIKSDGFLSFVDLDHQEATIVNESFALERKAPFIIKDNNWFKNKLLIDEKTSKTYGLFIKDGMNYLGLYDPESGTVGMGQKACREAYPRVFKVHGGYAYSVYFDRERQYGRINRMKID